MTNNNQWTIYSDGGSRGNPGPGGIGVIIQNNEAEHQISDFIGECTNNEAEYKAVIEGVKKIIMLKPEDNVEINWFLDSELVVRQLNGIYKIKQPHLLKMITEIKGLIFDNSLKINFQHVPREKNKIADMLVNKALDEQERSGIIKMKNKGYTFIEILISSIIFVSVMTIATAGFAQIMKYRASINAQLSVNQTARSLSEDLSRDIRNSVKGNITVTDKQSSQFGDSNILLLASDKNNSNKLKKLFCNSTQECSQITDYSGPYYLLIRLSDKIKVYTFADKSLFQYSPSLCYIQYQEFPLTENLTLDKLQGATLKYINVDRSIVGFNGMIYGTTAGSIRLEYDLTIASPNYSNAGARQYEKSILQIHSAATARQ